MNGTLRTDRKAVAWKDPHANWPLVKVPYLVVACSDPELEGRIIYELERRAPTEEES